MAHPARVHQGTRAWWVSPLNPLQSTGMMMGWQIWSWRPRGASFADMEPAKPRRIGRLGGLKQVWSGVFVLLQGPGGTQNVESVVGQQWNSTLCLRCKGLRVLALKTARRRRWSRCQLKKIPSLLFPRAQRLIFSGGWWTATGMETSTSSASIKACRSMPASEKETP